jgi:hypothetical protein
MPRMYHDCLCPNCGHRMWPDGECTSCDYDYATGGMKVPFWKMMFVMVITGIFAWSVVIVGLRELL